MIIKLLGIVLIVGGCGGIGFRIAANHCQEERNLRQLISILDYMGCELQYRLTTLPELCLRASQECSGVVSKALLEFTKEMESQVTPNLEICMSAAIGKVSRLSAIAKEELLLFGRSVGRFDLEGQVQGLEAVRQDCRRRLEELSVNRDVRLRSYQTLGLCAGAALAILFV